MKVHHPELDVTAEVPDRKGRTMFASGWEEVDPATPTDVEAAADSNVEHPDDPAVESVTYTAAEMKKRTKAEKAGKK